MVLVVNFPLAGAAEPQNMPESTAAASPNPHAANARDSSKNAINAKLTEITIPRFELHEATLAQALEILNKRSIELDPAKRGVTIKLKGVEPDAGPPITVKLANIPLGEALKFLTALTEMKYSVDADGITVGPIGSDPEPTATVKDEAAVRTVKEEAQGIILSKVELRDATVQEAIQLLVVKMKEMGRGANIGIKLESSASKKPPGKRATITLNLKKVSLWDALQNVAQQAGMQLSAEPYILLIAAKNAKPVSPGGD